MPVEKCRCLFFIGKHESFTVFVLFSSPELLHSAVCSQHRIERTGNFSHVCSIFCQHKQSKQQDLFIITNGFVDVVDKIRLRECRQMV